MLRFWFTENMWVCYIYQEKYKHPRCLKKIEIEQNIWEIIKKGLLTKKSEQSMKGIVIIKNESAIKEI